MSKTVIISGINGQLGQHLAKYLQENEPSLSIVGTRRNKSYGDDQPYIFDTSKVAFELMDLTDPHSIESLIVKYRPDYFINTAADAFVGTSWSTPAHYFETNALGVLHELEAIRKHSPHTRFFTMGCHDTETKAVTPNGIKAYTDLKVGDPVFTINEENQELEIKNIKRVVEYDYEGDMYLFNKGKLCITPNHNVLYHQNKGIKRIQCRDFIGLSYGFYPVNKPKVGKMLDENYLLSEHKACRVGNKGYGKHINSINSYDLMYLIGLYLGDGSSRIMKKKYVRKYRLREGRKNGWENNESETVFYECAQTIFDIPPKDEAFTKLTGALDRNKIKWSLHGQCDVTIHQWGLHTIFQEFGSSASKKCIPKWIFDLDSSYLVKILEGVIDGDGDENGVISTVSEKLQEDISILMVQCGISPTNRVRPTRSSYLKSENRIIKGNFPDRSVYGLKHNRGYRKGKYETVKCDGKVWCLEMEENHNFLVYRNGHFTFSGNTSEEFGVANNDGHSQNEDTRLSPKSPYGASKCASRYIVEVWQKSYNLFALQGWTFNFESEIRGEKYVTRKITKGVARINQATLNDEPFDPIVLGNLDSSRSWQYAGDVANGIWKMLNQEKPIPYVLSENGTHTIREFVQEAFSNVGIHVGQNAFWEGEGIDEKLVYNGRTLVSVSSEFYRPCDVTYLNGDSYRIRTELGWSPKVHFWELVERMVKHDIEELNKE